MLTLAHISQVVTTIFITNNFLLQCLFEKCFLQKFLDADAGNNGEVRYSLSGQDSSTFNIDAVSGLITTKSTLDYETKKLYKYSVTATDKGTSPHTATTTVTVNIRDVNDNTPAFTGSPYNTTVNEDVSIGTSVKTVSATDDDSGKVYLINVDRCFEFRTLFFLVPKIVLSKGVFSRFIFRVIIRLASRSISHFGIAQEAW